MKPFDIEREREVLTKHGYREWKPNRDWLHHNASYAFQKRFEDHNGTRYFITVWAFEPIRFSDGNTSDGGYMVELNCNEPHMEFTQKQFQRADDEAIELWEKRCLLFWETMECEYYEKP